MGVGVISQARVVGVEGVVGRQVQAVDVPVQVARRSVAVVEDGPIRRVRVPQYQGVERADRGGSHPQIRPAEFDIQHRHIVVPAQFALSRGVIGHHQQLAIAPGCGGQVHLGRGVVCPAVGQGAVALVRRPPAPQQRVTCIQHAVI